MSHWIDLSFAILAEVIGTSFLKGSDGFTKLVPSVIVVLGYGIAYAVWAGAGVALIALAGYVFFGQALDAPAVIGLLLIVSGVMVINLFSATVRPD